MPFDPDTSMLTESTDATHLLCTLFSFSKPWLTPDPALLCTIEVGSWLIVV